MADWIINRVLYVVWVAAAAFFFCTTIPARAEPEQQAVEVSPEQSGPKIVPSPSAPPALEDERVKLEASGDAAPAIKVLTGMEGSAAAPVQKVSATHFMIDVGGDESKNYFACRIEGAAGRIVRIDVRRPRGGTRLWASLNPVYAEHVDINDPESFLSPPQRQVSTKDISHNKSRLPDTRSERWHFAKDAWWDGHTFSVVQRFHDNQVVLAMRYPLTPTLSDRILQNLGRLPDCKVIPIGQSKQGRPLSALKVGAGTEEQEKTKPCILVYAREHGNEQDAGWAALGAAEFITAPDAPAAELRRKYTFLIIPLLNPDDAFAGVYSNRHFGFRDKDKTDDAVAYSAWFLKWIGDGKRLDIAIDLHNMESGEGANLVCGFTENSAGRESACRQLHELIGQNCRQSPVEVESDPRRNGWMSNRLGGWLSYRFGALFMLYECNCQAGNAHLSLGELKWMGGSMLKGTTDYLSSPAGAKFLSEVDALRENRQMRIRLAGGLGDGDAILQTERLKWSLPDALKFLREGKGAH
ncbi:MAG TPA: M14 family zinc carboxypeptidase [Tepidisphaeraceae bacterium]